MRKDASLAEGPFIGVIIRLTDKGFGFVQRRDQPGTDRPDEYFIHHTSMVEGQFDELTQGRAVRFYGKLTDKGLRVTEAELYDGEVPQASPHVVWDREGRRRDPRKG